MNRRYMELFQLASDAFTNEYTRSTEIFKDLDSRNQLIHAGEYGAYREKATIQLLRFILPQRLAISTGFVINSHNETSTQCDIVVYDHSNTPLMKADDTTRFFPAESVQCIGEVKSTITRAKLIEALLTLSRNKAIRRPSTDFVKHGANFDPAAPCNNIYSFVICEAIAGFEFRKLDVEIDAAYSANNIPNNLRHNSILSLSDGFISYQIPDDRFEPIARKGQTLHGPTQDGQLMPNALVSGDPNRCLRHFASAISVATHQQKTFYADPVAYLYS